MPDSYQISVATLGLHHGKRDGARRQAGVATAHERGLTVATRARVRIGVLALLATGLLGLGGCGVDSLFVGTGCNDNESSTWDLHEPTDPSTTLEIEDCRQDVGACDALCTTELGSNGDSDDTMTGCTVRFDGSTIHVQVDYDTPTDEPGCDSGSEVFNPTPEGTD
jgi:hypothetical protein